MRTIFLLALFSVLAAPVRVAAQQFEGIIRERMILASSTAVASLVNATPSPANVEEIFGLDAERVVAAGSAGPATGIQVMERTFYVSGQKLWVELQLPSMAALGGTGLILDREAGTVTMLLPMIRSYMVLDDALLQEQLGTLSQMYAGAAEFSDPSIQTLGAATINGLATEGFEIRAGEGLIARGWTAPELRAALPVEPNSNDPLATLAQRGLPIRTRALVRAEGPLATLYGPGYLYLATEVLSVERIDVDEARFTVPSDYTRMEAGAALPGLFGVPQD